MNDQEKRAWRALVRLGAKETELLGKHALDMRTVRIASAPQASRFCEALVDVVGRSGQNRRHVDRAGRPVFVVTDDPRPSVHARDRQVAAIRRTTS